MGRGGVRAAGVGRVGRLLSSSAAYRTRDHYTERALSKGLRSRAAYKLEEINARFGHFLRRGSRVVDLGAAPGGFSMVAARAINLEKRDVWESGDLPLGRASGTEVRRTLSGVEGRGRHGRLVCVDVQDMAAIDGATFVRGDATAAHTAARIARALGGREADVVLSDMAPATTSDGVLNHVRSVALAGGAARVARALLGNGGTLCVKVFAGGEEAALRAALAREFVRVRAFRPAASRKASREVYYVASGFVPRHLVGRGCDDVYDAVDGAAARDEAARGEVARGDAARRKAAR